MALLFLLVVTTGPAASGNRADRDRDGIPDDLDQCPEGAEDRDGFEDHDGCPDPDNDGDAVLDAADACPMEAGALQKAGCPVEDPDGDGIASEQDACPTVPEDLDGNEDSDGCPEGEQVDSDGDGVLDEADMCPDVPGLRENGGCPVMDRDGDTVTDNVDRCPDVPGKPPKGCPERVLVEVKGNKIEIKQRINFETNRAVIKGRLSFLILDQVSQVLKSNPKIEVVVEGHTDSRGRDNYNLQLSDDRAGAVREALVERKIAASRLRSVGYGETRPIATNRTRKGRATNRRVEFTIVQDDAKPE